MRSVRSSTWGLVVQRRFASMSGGPPGLPPNHPMAKFNTLLTTNKGAAILYKELLTSITSGDVEGSREVAALLAKHAAKMNEGVVTPTANNESVPPNPSRPASLEDAIPFSDDSILHAAEKLRVAGHDDEGGVASHVPVAHGDSDALRIIIIDSNFEMEEDDDVEGKISDTQMAVLDEYLRTDDASWKTQKRAISAKVLEAAKEVGISPAILVASPDTVKKAGESTTMSPFKECNVVIRCEVPAKLADGGVDAAISARLKEMRDAGGSEWTDEADAIARREMELSNMSVRYKVGIHHSLERALGHDLCAKFVEGAMIRLNDSDDAILSQPTMPFTFLMRTCLWFDLDAASEVKQ